MDVATGLGSGVGGVVLTLKKQGQIHGGRFLEELISRRESFSREDPILEAIFQRSSFSGGSNFRKGVKAT